MPRAFKLEISKFPASFTSTKVIFFFYNSCNKYAKVSMGSSQNYIILKSKNLNGY